LSHKKYVPALAKISNTSKSGMRCL
jgi:hypothetical protein